MEEGDGDDWKKMTCPEPHALRRTDNNEVFIIRPYKLVIKDLIDCQPRPTIDCIPSHQQFWRYPIGLL